MPILKKNMLSACELYTVMKEISMSNTLQLRILHKPVKNRGLKIFD